MIFPFATILLACVQAAPGQTDTTATPDPPTAQPGSKTAPVQGTPHLPGLRPEDASRPPLLREGMFLTRAHGSVDFEDSTGSWVFKAESDSKTEFRRTFVLLPSMALEDLMRTIETSDVMVDFEVTGRVLIYDGRNFLLPSVATPMDSLKGDEQPPPAPESGDQASGAPTNSLDEGDDAADRLEARLRERIGVLPRSSDATPRGGPAPAVTMREGTRLQNRRGAIVRDQNTGTWRFVFDAAGTDTVDPTMELLPCLLLERLERQAALSDLPAAVLISGEVTSYYGRNYLLPTIWRVARPSRNITP